MGSTLWALLYLGGDFGTVIIGSTSYALLTLGCLHVREVAHRIVFSGSDGGSSAFDFVQRHERAAALVKRFSAALAPFFALQLAFAAFELVAAVEQVFGHEGQRVEAEPVHPDDFAIANIVRLYTVLAGFIVMTVAAASSVQSVSHKAQDVVAERIFETLDADDSSWARALSIIQTRPIHVDLGVIPVCSALEDLCQSVSHSRFFLQLNHEVAVTLASIIIATGFLILGVKVPELG